MPKLEDLELQIKQTGAGVSRITKLTDALDKLAASAGKVSTSAKAIQSLGDSIKQASASGVAEGIKQTAEQMGKVSDGASEAAKTVNTFRQSVGKTTTHTHKFAKALLLTPVTAFANKVTGLLKPIGNLWRSFKRIAMYRALRTALKEITQGFATGVKNLYAWSGLVGNSFKGTMDSLATSMNYLRNSLGAMVSPLLDALAPAVDVLVDKFVDLVNLVNQFFATMTGKTTWRKALKTQKEYADNTNDAAAAQAKLNHQLMAFDELNNISTSSPSGRGGGGSNDGVTADDFEELELPDWAQDIKDAIDRGDWAGAGDLLAEKLNGLVDDWDAETAGEALGTKVGNFLDFANSAMRTFKFYDFGQKLGTFISNALSQLETKDKNGNVTGNKLGDFLSNMFNSAVSFINGFVWELDLSPLGTALGTALTNVFDPDKLDENGKSTPQNIGEMIAGVINLGIGFVQGFLDTTDFETVGEGLMTTLGTAIKNIDWEGLGTAISDLAGGIVDFIKGAVGYIIEHPGDILDAFGEFFSGLWGENGEGMANIVELAGWVAGIKLAFGGLKSAFSSTFGDALVGGAEEAFSATGAAATSVKGFMDTLAGKLGAVALVVGLTYIIATSGELNTPEKAAEKVEQENPFFNVFEEGDTDAFKVGFIDALKNDPEVKAAYEANLYQWGKDSAHQDQNAALAAARAVYEAKYALENSGSGNTSDWWGGVTKGLSDVYSAANKAVTKVKQLPPSDDDVTKFKNQTDKNALQLGLVEDAATNARKIVKQLPPDDDNVSKFKEQVAKERALLNGEKNSVKSAAKDAHTNGISKLAPTASDGTTFQNGLKTNLISHLTGDKNSLVSKAATAGSAMIGRISPKRADGNTFWTGMQNITTHLTGDKNSLVAKSTTAGSAMIGRISPKKADGNTFWNGMKNITTHLTGDKNSVAASAKSANTSIGKIKPSDSQTTAFDNAMKPWKKKVTDIGTEAGTASEKVAGIKPSDEDSAAFTGEMESFKDKVAAVGDAADTDKTKLDELVKDPYAIDITASNLPSLSKKVKELTDNLSGATSKTWKIKMEGDIELKSKDGKYWLVPGAAAGGMFNMGSMFVAGEAGPELVGTINGRTGVVSANEISGIGDAIYNTGEAEAALLKEQNALLRQILAKTGITLTPNAAAGKWVSQAQTAYARATGG